VKMVFCALRAITSYRYEDVISYIKCGYTDLTEDELNELESYTTDAMSVANADKPFRNLADMINDL